MQIRHSIVPYVPNYWIKLQSNGKLLPDDVIARNKAVMQTPDKYSRRLLDSEFAMIFTDGHYYILSREVSEGCYGKVILAQEADTGDWVAFKVMITVSEAEALALADDTDEKRVAKIYLTDTRLQQLMVRAVLQEPAYAARAGIALTNAADQPVQLLHYSKRYKSLRKHWYGMKWIEGKNINSAEMSDFPRVVQFEIVINLLRELHRVHGLRLIHRDMNQGNFKINYYTYAVKLLDFGLAAELNAANEYMDEFSVGCHALRAPELFNAFDPSIQNEISHSDLLRMLRETMKLSDNALLRQRSKKHYVYNIKTELYALGVLLKDVFEDDKSVEGLLAMTYSEKMTQKNALQRPGLEVVIQAFQALQRYLPLKDKIVKIGLIDVEEYLQYRSNHNRDTFYFNNGMGSYDQVYFLHNTDQPTLAAYVDAVRDAHCCGHKHVHREVLHSALTEELLEKLREQYREQHPMFYVKFYYIQLDKAVDLNVPRGTSVSELVKRFGLFRTEGATPSLAPSNQSSCSP